MPMTDTIQSQGYIWFHQDDIQQTSREIVKSTELPRKNESTIEQIN